jgi:hypothetical protein
VIYKQERDHVSASSSSRYFDTIYSPFRSQDTRNLSIFSSASPGHFAVGVYVPSVFCGDGLLTSALHVLDILPYFPISWIILSSPSYCRIFSLRTWSLLVALTNGLRNLICATSTRRSSASNYQHYKNVSVTTSIQCYLRRIYSGTM